MAAKQVAGFRCPICHELGQRTEEDIMPEWVRLTVTQTMRANGLSPPPRIRVRICAACNGYLARKLENPVASFLRPALLGEAVQLNRRQLKLLATWMAKCDLLMSLRGYLKDEDHDRAFRYGILIYGMMLEMLPPPGVAIRIANVSLFAHELPAEGYRSKALAGLSPAPALFSVTSCGHLAWETTITAKAAAFLATVSRDTRFTPLWPPPISEFKWPIGPSLSITELQLHLEEWRARYARQGGSEQQHDVEWSMDADEMFRIGGLGTPPQ